MNHADPTQRRPGLPPPSPLSERFALDPGVVFLNHGSFGACPRMLLDAQRALRDRMEREPVRFFVEDFEALLDGSRRDLAAFVNVRPEDLVFVPNATIAVATVLANLGPALTPGDDVLVTAHEYPACLNNVARTAARAGASVVRAELPFPLRGSGGAGDIVDAILARITPRTRIALISHTTSPTALVLPVRELAAALESRGIATIIDGAHGPGFVDGLDISAIGASFYTGNCHKWLCTPKGSAFLHIRADRQASPGGSGQGFRPLVLSNNAERPNPSGQPHMLTEFDYIGVQDYTPWMVVGDALREVPAMVGERAAEEVGWPGVISRNRGLALAGRDAICRTLDVEPPAPDSLLGSMASIVLPEHPPGVRERLAARPTRYMDALQDALLARHAIQVPVWSVPGVEGGAGIPRLVRISAQLYNSSAQYEYLGAALAEELRRERDL